MRIRTVINEPSIATEKLLQLLEMDQFPREAYGYYLCMYAVWFLRYMCMQSSADTLIYLPILREKFADGKWKIAVQINHKNLQDI